MFDLSVEDVGLWLGITSDVLQLIFIVVAAAAAFLAYFTYRKNRFTHLVSATLQVISAKEGKPLLMFRTLYAGLVSDVIQDKRTHADFERALRDCTDENPFVVVRDEQRRVRVRKAFLKCLAGLSGVEQKLCAYLGIDSATGLVLVGIPTFEQFGDHRDELVRPWYIRPEDLQLFLDVTWGDSLATEEPIHQERIFWLHVMAQIYFTGKSEFIPYEDGLLVKEMMHKVRWG